MGFTNPYPASRLTLDSTASINQYCVGFWPLTDGQGSVAKDITTGANDGSMSSGHVSWSSTGIGTAANFDGDLGTGYFDISTDLSRNQTAFSCSAWIRPDSVSYDDFIFYESNSVNVHQTRFGLRQGSSGRVQCVGRDDDGDSFTIFADSNMGLVSTGTWQHVVAVFDPTGSGCKVFLDGVDVTSTSDNTGDGYPNTASIAAFIGSINHGSYNFNGKIQNVRVFNAALTQAQVQTLYRRPWEGTNFGDIWPYSPPEASSMVLSTDTAATSLLSGMQAWFPLTAGSGSVAQCILHPSHTGTITNGTWASESIGTALQLGTTSNVSGTGVNVSTAATMSLWYREAGSTASGPIFLSLPRSTGGANGMELQHRGNGVRLGVYTNYSGSRVTATSGAVDVGDGEWHHIAGTYDGSSIRLYLDGVERASASQTGAVSQLANGEFNINALASGVSGFSCDGIYQNVAVWDRALSATEVATLYERPWEGEASYGDVFHHDPPAPASMLPLDNASGINTGLAAWYPLTETDDYASGVTDISGGAYHGSAHNGASSKGSLIGGVADFDGSNDYMNLGTSFWNDNIASGDDFCVNFWFNVDDISSDGAILGCWGSEQNFFIWVDVGGANVSLTSIGSGVGYGYTSVDLPVVEADRWYMGTLVADGTAGTVSVYLDGVFKVSASYSASLSTNTESMGLASERGSSNQRQMDGRIGNVRFWSRVLTEDEIWSIFVSPWLGSNYKLASGSTPLYNYIFRSKRFRRLV